MKLFHVLSYTLFFFCFASVAKAEYRFPETQPNAPLVSSDTLGDHLGDKTRKTQTRLLEFQQVLEEAKKRQDLFFDERLPVSAISPKRLVYEVTRTFYKRENGRTVYYVQIFDAETGRGLAVSEPRLDKSF